MDRVARIALPLVSAALMSFSACSSARHYMSPAASPPLPPSDIAALAETERRSADTEAPTGGAPAREPAETPAAPARPAKASPEAPANRVIIYHGELTVVVADIARSLDAVRHAAEALGGYMQALDASSITVRVPASRFDEAVTAASRLGEVTSKGIRADDVTEEMRDLDIRLANARRVHERLTALLGQSQKMEDTLKIEAELMRLTELIELIEGRRRYLQTHAELATLKVALNSPVPQDRRAGGLPFPWLAELGRGVTTGQTTIDADTSRWRTRGVAFDVPAGFIRHYDVEDHTETMSADGLVLKARRHANYKGGDIEFWSKLARRALAENGSVSVSSVDDLRPRGEGEAKVLWGSREASGQEPQGYALLIAVSRGHVAVVEAWGAREPFEQQREAIEKSLKSVKID